MQAFAPIKTQDNHGGQDRHGGLSLQNHRVLPRHVNLHTAATETSFLNNPHFRGPWPNAHFSPPDCRLHIRIKRFAF